MPRWNRALWAALASFAGALLLLGLAAGLRYGENAERTDDPAPLPPMRRIVNESDFALAVTQLTKTSTKGQSS